MATGSMSSNTTCQVGRKAESEGAWQGDNQLHFALPLLILQICLVVLVTRSLAFVLKPLRQPRVVAEIIALSGLDSAISKSRQAAWLNGNVSLDATLNAQLNCL